MTEDKQYTYEELIAKLTKKERIFCHQYIIDWNGARAARAAGYSKNTCTEIACQNLTKLHIRQYIDIIKNNLEEEAGISKLRNLQELSKIAYSSIAHLHNTWIELTEFEKLTDDQKSIIETIETKTVKKNSGSQNNPKEIEIEYVKLSLYSKTTAIDMINKMLGYNMPEKKELTGKDGKDLVPNLMIEVIDTAEQIKKEDENSDNSDSW